MVLVKTYFRIYENELNKRYMFSIDILTDCQIPNNLTFHKSFSLIWFDISNFDFS